MGKKLSEFAEKVIVGVAVSIVLAILSLITSFLLQFGNWSLVLAVAAFSSFLSAYLYWKLWKEQKGKAEATKLHGQAKIRVDELMQEVNSLKKEIVEKERTIQSLAHCDEENRKLKASVPSHEPGYREIEAGEFELKRRKHNAIPSWKSSIFKSLSVGDKIRVGISSDSKISCRIVKVRSDTNIEDKVQCEPALTWRHTYDISEEGDYAVLIYTIDKDSKAFIKIDYYSVGRFLGSKACMEVGGW